MDSGGSYIVSRSQDLKCKIPLNGEAMEGVGVLEYLGTTLFANCTT